MSTAARPTGASSPRPAAGAPFPAELAQDDRGGVAFLYPAPPAPALDLGTTAPPPPSLPGAGQRHLGCSSTPGTAGLLPLILILGFLLALRFRRRAGDDPHPRVFLAVVAVLATPAAAGAQPLGDLPAALTHALGRADTVVVVTVHSVSSRFEGTLIVSTVEARVDECLRGECPRDLDFEVVGGRVGDVVQALSSRDNPAAGDRFGIRPRGIAPGVL